MPEYDVKRVEAYVERVVQLDRLDFKLFYLWITEALEWANGPKGVSSELIEDFRKLSAWERANVVDRLRRHLDVLCQQDFAKLSGEARLCDAEGNELESDGG